MHKTSLNSAGIAHLLLLVAVVVVVVVAGVGMLVASRAESFSCRKGKVLVNAKPADFVQGKYKRQAINNMGLICVKAGTDRPIVKGVNSNTVAYFSRCKGGVFAFDENNTSGTGFRGGKAWAFKLFAGTGGETTYYCLNKRYIGKTVRESSFGHAYKFVTLHNAKNNADHCSNGPSSPREPDPRKQRPESCNDSVHFKHVYESGVEYNWGNVVSTKGIESDYRALRYKK